MVDWKKIRRDFPITKRFTYLDHASAAPMPRPVYERTLQYYKELAGFADFSWNRWIARREDVRRKVAQFIHAEPDEIAFTSSTSNGMNLIAELIADQGNVLTNTLEFPATTVPWIHRNTTLKFLEPAQGIISVDQMKRCLKPDVKTILTSFVQFQNGFRQNLEAIGKIKGSRFFVVNATQGFGYLPIDVKRSKIDFLATNSYKWLMAGYGGGILYLNRKWIRAMKPVSAGWRSVLNPEEFNNREVRLKKNASRYEFGCPPFPHIFAIGAGIAYLSEIGLSNIEKRILHLTDFLIDQLKTHNFRILSPLHQEARSGIIVFYVKNAEKLTKKLLARKIYVSRRGGGIHVAPHIHNTEAEIAHFMKVLREEVKNE